jgi:GNAT superfamily N-acetyltransferase
MKHHYNVKLGGRFLAVADLVWHTKKTLMLTRINVPTPYRGQGHASKLLKQILADADAEGITIHLHASPSGGLDESQLIAWYERHGFVTKNCLIMERNPQEQWYCPHCIDGAEHTLEHEGKP